MEPLHYTTLDNRERVRLKTTGGVQGGEYINANFVDVSLHGFNVSAVTILSFLVGIQVTQCLHSSPSSPPGHSERLLEDGVGVQVHEHCRVVSIR